MKSILPFCVLFLACVSARQGIEGQLSWISGNQMPGPGKAPAAARGVEREIYIYEVLTTDEVVSSDGFITQVNKPLVQKVQSNAQGHFKVKLNPGTYSLLVKEARGLYANRFDQQNHIQPITVKQGERTWVTIIIDYEAAY